MKKFIRLLCVTRWRPLFIALLGSSVFAFSLAPCSAQVYDEQIKSAWRRYLPQYSWGIGWAQIQQESAGNPDAVSPAGAVGLAQFMPLTWNDMLKAGAIPKGANPRDARHAIQTQAFYMMRLNSFWSSPRPDSDRIRLALASYNAGAGNILKSQKKCNNPSGYTEIMQCLPSITGRHAQETLGYVPHIEKHYYRRFGRTM